MTKINKWNDWEKNFYAAKAFFESKGNMITKGRLKNKWFKAFKEAIEP